MFKKIGEALVGNMYDIAVEESVNTCVKFSKEVYAPIISGLSATIIVGGAATIATFAKMNKKVQKLEAELANMNNGK